MWAGIASIALIGGAMSIALANRSDDTATEAAARGSAATAVLETRDLVERETFPGVLGYADAVSVKSARAGTLTWLPREGTRIERGGRLYEIDKQASFLMYGRSPAWRDLGATTSDGRDVEQLERNLVALGYDPYDAIEIDAEFDAATSSAIRRWQEDRGLTEDGVISLGEIVFAPAARRVGELRTMVGDRIGPGAPLLDMSSTRKVVSIGLEASKRDLVRKARPVTVTLPDGTSAPGRIADIGKVARVPEEQGGSPTIDVQITLKGGQSSFDQAPVEVEIEVARVEGALAAPVAALLALAEGGYALEVIDGARTSLVPIEIGEFADGWVEISAPGLSTGDEVVTAP
jgi:peptidoglycan hydrolase-like protein with peptidoglycan-binding domain